MAVMPMKRISIYALKNRRKQILELIQRRGVVEIETAKRRNGFCQDGYRPGKIKI